MAEMYLAEANGGKGPCIMLTHDEIYHNKSHATRRFANIEKRRLGELDNGERVWKHFLDSGAFGLYAREVKQKAINGLFDARQLEEFKNMTAAERSAFKRANSWLFRQASKSSYKYYHSPGFWERVDTYAKFVKEHKIACDYYANLDVIYNPKLTWKVQQYLEDEYKLEPVPVIHSGTPLKWVHHYLDKGYDFIGLGGFGGSKYISAEAYMLWASKIYQIICPPPKRVPIVKVHGFAMTNFDLLSRFPWWSVDSATWTKAASYGSIYVPQQRGGRYVFNVKPHMLTTSCEASSRTKLLRSADGAHLRALPPEKKRIITRWLDRLGVPLGSVDKWGDMKERGVLSHYSARMEANLRYFEYLEKSLPTWPWPYLQTGRERTTFSIKV
jgi:hypothetical protein